MTPPEPPEDVIAAVDELLDVAVTRHHERISGETFSECHICGGWDEHKPLANGMPCPLPALITWLETPV